MSTKGKLKHLNAIADALTAAGYEVEQPKADNDFLDVWGYEDVEGSKRRRKCFEEIYCSVFDVHGLSVSYWTTNQTYDAQAESIEVEETHNGLRGVDDLIASLSVQPLKRKKTA